MLISYFENMHRKQLIDYKAFLLAISMHVFVVMVYLSLYQDRMTQIQAPELAVMIRLSDNIQAISEEKQVIGVDQQISVASQKKVKQILTEKQPTFAVNENADILVEKPKRKVQLTQLAKIMTITPPVKLLPIINDNVSSLSAPSTSRSVARQQASEVEAYYDSDSDTQFDALALWQAKTKGHLNRYKVYPEEAKNKGLTGIPKVRFIVDPQGYVISNELINSSGIRSLDREAQRVLKRAQPLPIPPIEVLFNNKVIVEMSIEFSTLSF